MFEDLKDQPYNTVDGVNYGVPHGRGANLLMWNTDAVKPDPTSWGVLLDPVQASKYKGQISVYDDPVYIADAAVYLKTHQPDLGIDNPYELDDEQFNAAVDLLKQQQPNVGEYWDDREADLSRSPTRTSSSARPGSTSTSRCRPRTSRWLRVQATGFLPEEGRDRMVDTWMISSQAATSELHVPVDGSIISPEANARSRSTSVRPGAEQVL